MTFNFPNEDVIALSEDNEDKEFDDRWNIDFDGVINLSRNKITIIISLEQKESSIAIKLPFDYMNNVLEYEACISKL